MTTKEIICAGDDANKFQSYCDFIDCCRSAVGSKYRMFKSYAKDLSCMRDENRRKQELTRFKEWLEINTKIESRQLTEPIFDSKHTIYFKSVLDLGNETIVEEFWTRLIKLEKEFQIDRSDQRQLIPTVQNISSIDDKLAELMNDPLISEIVVGLQNKTMNVNDAVRSITRQIKSGTDRRKMITLLKKILSLLKEQEFLNRTKTSIVTALSTVVASTTSNGEIAVGGGAGNTSNGDGDIIGNSTHLIDEGINVACSILDHVMRDDEFLNQCCENTVDLLKNASQTDIIDTVVDYIGNIFNQTQLTDISSLFETLAKTTRTESADEILSSLSNNIGDKSNASLLSVKETIDFALGMISTVNDPRAGEICDLLKKFSDNPEQSLLVLGKLYEKFGKLNLQ